MKECLEAVTAVLATGGTGESEFFTAVIVIAVILAIIFLGAKKKQSAKDADLSRILRAAEIKTEIAKYHRDEASGTQEVYDETISRSPEQVAEKIAESIGTVFSPARFTELFGAYTLPEGWSLGDALGVWYSLSNLALVIAAWRFRDQTKAFRIIDHGRLVLLRQWGISGNTRDRYMSFVNETEGSAVKSYINCKTGKDLELFFTRYTSCILGKPVEFSESGSSFEDILKGVQYGQADMITTAAVCRMFVDVLNAALEFLKSAPIDWSCPVPTST